MMMEKMMKKPIWFKRRVTKDMELLTHAHRYADAIINQDPYLFQRFREFTWALTSISDQDLIADFHQKKDIHATRGTSFKSLTPSINDLLKQRMATVPGWACEVDIFNDTTGMVVNTEWRLDFACADGFAVEVAFNHGEAIAWNLLKPVLASELNHVQKALQTRLGIYVCATEAMKRAGNIDSASGSFEKVQRYLRPMMNQLTTPMMLIGIDAPRTFYIDKRTREVCYYDPSLGFFPNNT